MSTPEVGPKLTMTLAPDVVPISSWDDFQSHMERIAGAMPYRWLFRGQRESTWPLVPTIERGRKLAAALQTEGRLLREFRSKAHLYSDKLPREDDLLGWFGAMQHYGIPTRLLDWTFSAYIALYFAAEVAAKESPQFSVWAISRYSIDHGFFLRAQHYRPPQTISMVQTESTVYVPNLSFGLYSGPHNAQYGLVSPLVPKFHVSRFSAQQGCFLYNCNAYLSFESSLAEMMNCGEIEPGWLLRFDFSNELREEILRRLMHMNIHPASLLPDLEGLARFITLKNSLFSTDGDMLFW